MVDLEERLEAILLHARAAWPDVTVPDAVFARRLGARLSREESLLRALETTQGPDFYLACACAEGDPVALRAFEKVVVKVVPGAVSRLKLPKTMLDDVQQVVREKLLVGDGGPPKIAEYAGRGPLEVWVRVVAVRAALTLLRKEAPGAAGWGRPTKETDEQLLNMAAPEEDPENGLLKARYAGAFRAALATALAGLPAQDRTVLRLHFVDGMNIAQIGTIYRVHRATVARWIARSRMTLLAHTKGTLRAELQLDPAELDSLMRHVRSQIHLSLSGILRSDLDGL